MRLHQMAAAAALIVGLMACGGGVEEADEPSATSEPTTTTEVTPTTEAPTTTTEAPSPALTAEDEAACRYLLDEVDRPGNYDPTTVFPTMAEMATDGGEVESSANDALARFQETGDVDASMAVDLMTVCVSVVGE